MPDTRPFPSRATLNANAYSQSGGRDIPSVLKCVLTSSRHCTTGNAGPDVDRILLQSAFW